MDQYGIAGAIGQGLQSGVEAYQRERSYQDEQAYRRKLLAMQMLKSGVEEGPDGLVKLNPVEQKKREMEQQKYDSGSEISQRHRAFTRGLLEAVKPGLGDMIPEDMSAAELEEKANSGLLGKETSGLLGVQGRQITADRVGEGNAIKREGLDLRRESQASQAASVFDKDTNLQALTKQQQAIQRGAHTLQNVKILTPQLFNEVQLDVANAISGGRSSAVSTQNKVEFESLATKWAELEQRVRNKPEDINAPEVKAYMMDVLNRLNDAYAHNMQERTSQLASGRTFEHNPAAQKAIAAKVKAYGSGLMTPEGSGLMQSAPAAGGKVKVSNGKETLMIDRADLADAMKDGYQEVK